MPTASPTEQPTATAAGDGLDETAEPNFGTLELTSGFVPDPQTKEIISGGSVDASYLGGQCRGYATRAPDYAVEYEVETGFVTLLRFYFEGAGDTTLIINSPSGAWLCNDDSYDTVSPTVDVDDPVSGRYDIWIGSYVSGQTVLGTLSITELDSNHPTQ